MPGAPQQADINDAEQNKAMGIVAYILFFIPMLTGTHRTSPFVKFHVNQGFLLFVVSVVYSIISSILRSIVRVPLYYSPYYHSSYYYTPAWLSGILWLISLPILALCIIGIINAANGKMKPLPVIGTFNFSLVK